MALCDDCFAAFQTFESKELQVHVDQNFPGFVCEQCSISPFSPGPVDSGESVVFLTVHPNHYDEVRETLVPLAFEQLTRNDLSVLRMTHARQAEIQRVRSALKTSGSNAAERKVDKCCLVPVGEIREIRDSEQRVFGVYDTAIEELPSHASIFVRKDYLSTKATKLQARFTLLQLFKNYLRDVDDLVPADRAK